MLHNPGLLQDYSLLAFRCHLAAPSFKPPHSLLYWLNSNCPNAYGFLVRALVKDIFVAIPATTTV